MLIFTSEYDSRGGGLSFGLSRVEAYDAAGRLVYKQKASGSEALIGTRSWPSGTYLPSVNTPLGLANKKLTIRR